MVDRLILKPANPGGYVSKSRAAALLVAVLALAACSAGEDGGGDGVASMDDVVTTTAASESAETPAGPADVDEAAVLEFAGCMREGGIDFPDPTIDSEGNVGFDLEELSRLADLDEDELEAAFENCFSLLEGVSFGFERIFETEFQDSVLDFAACMRSNGFEMPDPDFSQLTTTGQIFPEELDITDPDFEPAFEACQDELPGIPGISTE